MQRKPGNNTDSYRMFSVFGLLACVLWFPASAFAACSSPVGALGDFRYDATHIPKFCDGTAWDAAGTVGNGTAGGCTVPTAVEGTMKYNVATHVMQFCGGTNWVNMGATGAGGACTSPTGSEGTMALNSCHLQSCNGTWVTIAGAALVIGAVQCDGSFYAGLSPDGNVPMYTTPCDLGMTGTQGSCTGTRTQYAWGTSAAVTGYTSAVTGKSNTANLIANYGAYTDTCSPTPVVGVPAAQACAALNVDGHSDWYLPAQNELSVLYTNRVAIGGFDLSGTFTTGYYKSSTDFGNTPPDDSEIYDLFSTGVPHNGFKCTAQSVRCVRR